MTQFDHVSYWFRLPFSVHFFEKPVTVIIFVVLSVFRIDYKTVSDIASTEQTIAALKKTIKSKEDDVKVCQTRLYLREKRPGVDQCRDPVQYQ
jgi:Tektin family